MVSFVKHTLTNIDSKTAVSFVFILLLYPIIYIGKSVKRRYSGADPGFDQGGGPQIVTGLKLPFWGLSFVEFLVLGPHFWWSGGGPGPPGPPPGSAPAINVQNVNFFTKSGYRATSSVRLLEPMSF